MPKKNRRQNLVSNGNVVASVPESEPVAVVPETEESVVDPNKDAANVLLGTKEAAPVAVGASKYRGVKTGRRVQDFQDWQLSVNHERKLTDVQILEEMKAEFPEAQGAIFIAALETRLSILRAVRRLYNAGRHCKAWPKPEVPSVEYKG